LPFAGDQPNPACREINTMKYASTRGRSSSASTIDRMIENNREYSSRVVMTVSRTVATDAQMTE
jgi:hypothetical protein